MRTKQRLIGAMAAYGVLSAAALLLLSGQVLEFILFVLGLFAAMTLLAWKARS